MCLSVLLACMFVYHMYAVSEEARKGHYVPQNLSYRWLLVAMWELGTKCWSFERAACALNCRAIFPVLRFPLKICMYIYWGWELGAKAVILKKRKISQVVFFSRSHITECQEVVLIPCYFSLSLPEYYFPYSPNLFLFFVF